METIIIYMLIAIIISAICSLCEACLSSTPMSFVSTLKGKSGADILRNFKENMDKPLSAILIINTIANTVGASIVGSAAASYAVEQGIDGATFIGIISAIFTVLILMFAEIVPKTIGANYWKSLTLYVTRVINVMIYITYPLVKCLNFITRLMSNENAVSISREEIIAMTDEGAKEGVIDKKENMIIQRILKLNQYKAEDIMTPASVVYSVADYANLSKNSSLYESLTDGSTFSRIPVMNKNNYCVGYILKDELDLNDTDNVKISDITHSIHNYIDSTDVADIFNDMVKNHEHISAITDEYGTFRGIVTLEDVIETILNIEIVDETDDVQDMQEYAKKQYHEVMKDNI